MLLTCALTMVAQVTTSALTGKVSMQDTKEEVIGATVQVVHDPSGTKYSAVTNIDGRFSIQGMRSGGPYTVTVSYVGYDSKVFKEIYLDLAETYNLSVWLSENANELKEIVVSGKASKFAAEKTGASTNIRNNVLQELPTISRSIGDIAKLSPYYGGNNSFAGGNGKPSTRFSWLWLLTTFVRPTSLVVVSMPLQSRVPILSRVPLISITTTRTCTVTASMAPRTLSLTPHVPRPTVSHSVVLS